MIRLNATLLAAFLAAAPGKPAQPSGAPSSLRMPDAGADRVLQEMFTAIDGIETLSFRLFNAERVAGRMLEGEQRIVLQKRPFSIYMYMLKPVAGAELLYVDGRNGNDVIYNPSAFPYIRLHLDPMGVMMRRNNHHTIFEAGFGYLADILKSIHAGKKAVFSLEDDVVFEGRKCRKIVASAASFRYVSHTVREGETLVTIARKRKVSEHMILEANKEMDGYNDVKAGEVISVPNLYAGRIELYVDKETSLPVMQKIFDDKGLYEKYIYRNVHVNARIPQETFSENNLGRKVKG